MTAPRPILPGKTYLVTRRCAARHLYLRPSALMNHIFQFALAHAATAHGILLHAYCVMSDHFHLVVTDPDGRLPAFCQQLNSIVARACNALLGRRESFWGPGSYSAVCLEDRETVVAKSAYTLANPVDAGLVRHGSDWPGLWSDPESVGQDAASVERPDVFFRDDGEIPAKVKLALVPPPGFVAAEFRDKVVAALTELEIDIQARQRRNGRGFLGRVRVLRQNPSSVARRPEAPRTLNPRFAGSDDVTRVAALSRLRDFWARYREAWARWRQGMRKAVFPRGTYLMRVQHQATCEAFA